MTQQLNFFDQPAPDAELWPDFGQETRLRAAPEWLKLCRRQPALLELEREAAAGTDPGYLVPRLEKLAGWYCDDPKLKNRRAFDDAFAALGRAFALKRPLAGEALGGRK